LIKREVAEALWPDFVKKLDDDLAEVNKINRKLCPLPAKPKVKPKDIVYKTNRRKILECLEEHGPLNTAAIHYRVSDLSTYNTIAQTLVKMLKAGEIVRIERGLYDAIKKAP